MTDQLQADRDEIAEMCGWKRWNEEGDGIDHDDASGWYRRSKTLVDPEHPIPASLDFVSRVWPEGVTWRREWEYYEETDDGEDYTGHFKWYATTRIGTDEKRNIVGLGDSGDELTDRMTLLLKVLVWLRDNDRLAFDAACEKIRKECGK